MTLPSNEEWKQVMDEVERLRMQKEAELRQQQVQAQLEAELARQQATWNSMQGKAWRVTGISGNVQGKTATVTVYDDPYETEYKNVAKHIRNALYRIITAKQDMEKMRDWRYTSPYHPKRWRRWLQKHRKPILDTLFFGPVILGFVAGVVYSYYLMGLEIGYVKSTAIFWFTAAVVYAMFRFWRKEA